jgi:hypothetical protein
MSVTTSLGSALIEALTKYEALQPKWIKLLNQLFAEYGGIGLLRYQSDLRIDLLLRAMEDEAAAQAEPQANEVSLLVGDLQSALTRYWLLSAYEALRIAKASEAGKANAKLQSLYEKFRLVRIPLAKLQIANDRLLKEGILLVNVGDGPEHIPELYNFKAKTEYHPPVLFNRATGSIGWDLVNVATGKQEIIFRRDLSNGLLGLFD